ncbi:hypothetical protein Ocin01_00145 [Orchesella cincta]|uniref:Family 31 glucosidase KIAA1161 n=1 Tax=Orchesella cincta TaxID=48709 RepID=A0A1D2NNL6_ORCCI|nr:hypothetical protein Ocin01_00145 [Orchesella cincta]
MLSTCRSHSGRMVLIRARGKLGLSAPAAIGQWAYCNEEQTCVEWGDFAKVELTTGSAPGCGRVEWTSAYAREIEDCYDIEDGVHWYGGGETYIQTWPIENNPRVEGPYVTSDFFRDTVNYYGGVVENYWLLSNGAALVVDPDTPLFFSLNTTHRDRVCFVARDQAPFTKRKPLTLKYEWCTAENVKEAHKLAMGTFFEKPSGMPDETMLIRPFWSTWAEFHENFNQSMVLDYARKVVSEGFGNSSHIEIDDKWEGCRGQEEFDPVNFPDPKAMIDEIKNELNLRVTAWVHPFINYECPLFNEGMSNGYFVKDAKGKTGITWWWQGSDTGIIDVTNEAAVTWWADRLRALQESTGLDSFKFDAGETLYLPASPVLAGDEGLWPHIYSTKYVEACAKFGGLIETRVARLNQKEPTFIRMLDKESRWGYNNGVRSMIPTLLHFGIVGYPYVLPDMIGGNAYGDEIPSKEMYVRWMQLNIFMPAVQFSVVPWKFDSETVQISLDVLAQREKYRDEILAAARQAEQDGTYMLGDNILVAPVVVEGAVSRNIYLPAGTWTSGVDGEVVTGPRWLNDYPVPLNVVPYFIKS